MAAKVPDYADPEVHLDPRILQMMVRMLTLLADQRELHVQRVLRDKIPSKQRERVNAVAETTQNG